MLTPSARLAAAPPLSPPPGWSAERLELHHGLLDRPAHIDLKFLYDALGSSLFAAITQLPEYYPTRCEAEIHAAHGAAIARHAGAVETLLDLGAGDCAKAERLFPSCGRAATYPSTSPRTTWRPPRAVCARPIPSCG